MAESMGGKARSGGKAIAAWLIDTLFKGGWRQWLLLFCAFFLAILLFMLVFDAPDYRKDPAALVPRSVDLYLEVEDAQAFLREVGTLEIWESRKRSVSDAKWSQLQIELVSLIGGNIANFRVGLPMQWLSLTDKAAFSVALGDNPAEEAWALYLKTTSLTNVLDEIKIEPGWNLETIKEEGGEGVYSLTDAKGGKLFFGLVRPWFIVSSSAKLPEFAMAKNRKPVFTLAKSQLIPKTFFSPPIRGVFSPTYLVTTLGDNSRYSGLADWIAPNSRIAFTSSLDGKGGLDSRFTFTTLSENVGGGGMWPLVKLIAFVVGLLCAGLVVVVILNVISRGWFIKLLAKKAAVSAVSAPEAVQPSSAFQEDTGGIDTNNG